MTHRPRSIAAVPGLAEVLLYFLLPCVWRLAREREGSATDNLESDEELEDCTQDDPEARPSWIALAGWLISCHRCQNGRAGTCYPLHVVCKSSRK